MTEHIKHPPNKQAIDNPDVAALREQLQTLKKIEAPKEVIEIAEKLLRRAEEAAKRGNAPSR
ncbi:MAG: hypothetical protein EPO35_05005 [Acidobacteria bacterium]|nr:MAG: hypothetical protein EPO35_05005 [Acidobacteriota bacterium]